jgi:hypothetical protein
VQARALLQQVRPEEVRARALLQQEEVQEAVLETATAVAAWR